VLGTPGASTLFGGSTVNDNWRNGARIWIGSWLDDERIFGVEANFFILSGTATGFNAGSTGNPILARPFFNVLTGMPDSELVAFPGITSGTLSAHESSTLLGAGAWLRCALCCGDCYRVDALLGYRFLRLTGRLGIAEDLTSTLAGDPAIPPGTQFTIVDQFNTANDFHGADFGLAGEFRRGLWFFDWRTTLAVGANLGTVDINGTTTVTAPGFAPVTAPRRTPGAAEQYRPLPPGSLLAGTAGRPQAGLSGHAPAAGVRGLRLPVLDERRAPGGQIDTAVNPNQLPPPILPLVGPNRPAPLLNTTEVWVQGVSVGLVLRY
jgi:hypothetical protein